MTKTIPTLKASQDSRQKALAAFTAQASRNQALLDEQNIAYDILIDTILKATKESKNFT